MLAPGTVCSKTGGSHNSSPSWLRSVAGFLLCLDPPPTSVVGCHPQPRDGVDGAWAGPATLMRTRGWVPFHLRCTRIKVDGLTGCPSHARFNSWVAYQTCFELRR